MNEETFPPSPNWYLSNVVACSGDGIIAYGARCNIVIAKYPSQVLENRTPEISIISNAHTERVTAVVFSTSRDETNPLSSCLASAGDDSIIRIWNWHNLTPLLAHNSHVEGAKVTALDWSRVDPNLVVSADEQGTIVCWDLFSNTTQRMSFGRLMPTCLSCCPHRRDLVALGTKSGLVCTVSVKGGGKMLHRMRGHDTEVVSLSWCPVKYNVIQSKETQEDMLLASGAKEKSIYIWRAGGDGRYETVVSLPTIPMVHDAPGSQQHRSRLGSSVSGGTVTGCWTCVAWPDPNTILSSSLFGELVACNLQQNLFVRSGKQSAAAKLWKLVHSCHARGLFSIAFTSYQKSQDHRQKSKEKGAANGNVGINSEEDSGKSVPSEDLLSRQQVAWTAAQDRRLVACYWESGKILTNISTLGGYVYCIATSPLDSNRIAVGVGDGTIRIWNLSNSSLEVTTLWQKIKGKVMALAWHPTREGWLAYGTSEGRIGLYDVSCGKPPILFLPHHRRNVYTLCWGPSLCKPDEAPTVGTFLYSCGDGEIVQYDVEKPNEEPQTMKGMLQASEINSPKSHMRTDIAWKPDFSLLAVGNEDGTVNIVSAPHLLPVHTLFAHKKLIQCLAWHPESTATDTSYSPYQHWLAVASNETSIKVFDLSIIIKDAVDNDLVQVKATENYITLSGHLNRIVNMCWSPHIGGQLVSVSYDGTAQVWNVPAQQPVANFPLHSSHVYCCAWSPLDPDLVITGSADNTLRVWKISNQSHLVPSEKKKLKKEKKDKKVALATESNEAATSVHSKEDVLEVDYSQTERNSSGHTVEYAKNEKEVCEASVTQNVKKKIPTRKSFFPVSHQQSLGKNQHLINCYHLLATRSGNLPIVGDADVIQTTEPAPYLGFFGDREAMHKLLDSEAQYHVKGDRLEMAQQIELWKGNVAEMLKEAARRKQLSDWLVSLAPMASHRLWMEMCKTYSEQLEVGGQYQKAASYLLACHKVNDAIDLLMNHQLFREALAIARSRFPPDDQTTKYIVSSWSKHLTLEGNYELAAECLISIGELVEAAMLIRKRDDETSLKLASVIANEAGAEELASMLAIQCVKKSFLVGNWKVATEVAPLLSHVKHLTLLMAVHHTLTELTSTNLSSLCSQWLQQCKHMVPTHKPLLEIIATKWQIDFNEEVAHDTYAKLLNEFGNTESPDTQNKMWLVMCVEIALSYLSAGDKRLHHLVSALNTCYQYEHLLKTGSSHYLLQLCIWLTPQGPFSCNSVFHSEDTEDLQCVKRSLRAYLCVGVLDWMTANLNTIKSSFGAPSENGTKGENGQVAESKNEKENGIPDNEQSEQGEEDCNLSENLHKRETESVDRQKQSVNENEIAQEVAELTISSENKDKTECVKSTQCNKCVYLWDAFIELLNRCMNDVLSKDSFQYFQDCVQIRRLEREIAIVIAKSRQGETSNIASASVMEERDMNSTLDKDTNQLEQLKERKHEFEVNYSSSPNLFITYCRIKNLLVQNESKKCIDLYAQLESLWKDITASQNV